jgi:hypothetical protein
MLSGVQRVGDLEIFEDHDFQRKSWAVQRYLWTVMALVVLLGLLGLFGTGPLSNTSAGNEGSPLVLHYNRFGRQRSPSKLVADMRPGTAGNEARLWLSAEFLAGMEIEDIEPQPERVEAGPDRSALVFRLVAPGTPTRVTISMRPETLGQIRGHVSVDDAPALRFAQFIYP